MSYQVLARKWRPRYFAEMIGQEHVVRALANALDQERLHHAYLFTGTRGVGKTTVARIFAKSLNCEKGVSATPCGECGACVEIDEGRFIDLIEVDAASRTGVDDTRELMDNVSYAPTRGRYKVYLIDEVHMFSKSSFNALLKTLEEPPPHVKFLLATTDPQKLLPTVLSRCLQFNLKRVSIDAIGAHISHILDAESQQAAPAAINRIARAADGSVRDSLSLLDQAIAFSQGEITLEHVDAMLGGVSQQRVYDLLDAVREADATAVFSQLAELDDYAPDYYSLLSDLLALLHQIAVCQAVPAAMRETISDPERVGAFAHAMSSEDVQLYYQIALNGRRDMPHAPDERDALEMTLLRMIAFLPREIHRVATDTGASRPAAKPATANVPSQPAIKTAPAPVTDHVEPVVNNSQSDTPITPSATTSTPSPVSSVSSTAKPAPADIAPQSAQRSVKPFSSWQANDWGVISKQLGLQGMYAQLAAHCSLVDVAHKQVNLMLNDAHQHLNNPKMVAKVNEALNDLVGESLTLNVSIGRPPTETPAQSLDREKRERQQQAEQSIIDDPVVQDIQQRFDAAVVVEAIEPIQNNH